MQVNVNVNVNVPSRTVQAQIAENKIEREVFDPVEVDATTRT